MIYNFCNLIFGRDKISLLVLKANRLLIKEQITDRKGFEKFIESMLNYVKMFLI
jgi:hypothetical protein